MEITAFSLAQRFVGVDEVSGQLDNPQILAMLRLDNSWPENDEVPWCSGFVNYICHLLRLPRSKSLLARSWLEVGKQINLASATPGFDVVILQRGSGRQPGIEDTTAPGHVGFYAGHTEDHIQVLGGNQGNTVKVASYPRVRLLSVRRIYED